MDIVVTRMDFYNPMDCSLPGSSIRGIFQARVLEWIAIAFSKARLLPTSLLHRRGLLGLPRSLELSPSVESCGCGLGPSPVTCSLASVLSKAG